jgi:NADH:ubiquinone oxidoreductase subunit H
MYYQFPQNMVFFFAIKFCFAIALLILIRGGTPRYRYDYLTKLG